MRTEGPYLFRQVATCGCEVLDREGRAVAWTVDEMWAATIVHLLNEIDHFGVTVVAEMDNLPEATCCRCGH